VQRKWRRLAATLLALPLAAALALAALVMQPFVGPVPSDPPAVDPHRLRAHVHHLAVDLHPRSVEQPALLERAMGYVAREFAAAGAQVESQPVAVDGQVFRNVIARFGPTQPADAPLIVVGAHVDAHGRTPGADDNASGVAGLIELARLLGAQPPPHAVELVAYTLEEPPYFRTRDMGSAFHARALRAAGREVRLMVSLEMIGLFSDVPGSQRYPVAGMDRLYPDRGDFIAIVSRISARGDLAATRRAKALMSAASALPVRSINAPPMLHGIDFSDHLNYWAEGWPALMVTDTAFLRNQRYHTAHDTPETLDYARMAQVVRGVFALVRNY
jgi:Zn-dependent M28 family amino/carboxypeptidase